MKTFDGYDPASPTLKPSPLCGGCMGPAFEKWKTCYVDRRVPVVSGDIVRMWLAYKDGTVMCIVKELHCTRDGRWWGRCYDGVFQIAATGQQRTPAQPYFIEKVVALSEDYYAPSRPVPRKADGEQAAMYEFLSRDARSEWEREGFPIGVPFPGLLDGRSSP